MNFVTSANFLSRDIRRNFVGFAAYIVVCAILFLFIFFSGSDKETILRYFQNMYTVSGDYRRWLTSITERLVWETCSSGPPSHQCGWNYSVQRSFVIPTGCVATTYNIWESVLRINFPVRICSTFFFSLFLSSITGPAHRLGFFRRCLSYLRSDVRFSAIVTRRRRWSLTNNRGN